MYICSYLNYQKAYAKNGGRLSSQFCAVLAVSVQLSGKGGEHVQVQ